MKLSESLELLNSLGMIDWITSDTENATRLIVNSIADYFLEEHGPLDYRPFIESEYVYGYFSVHSWEIDWYGMLSHDFAEAVELNINSIALHINDSDPMMSVEETEKYVLGWVHEWRQKVKVELAENMEKYA